MTNDPTTASGWGIQLSKLWMACGKNFPVDVKEIALEVTKARFSDPIGIVKEHGISGIDGMLSKRSRGDWCISYDEKVAIPGRINFTLGHELGHYLLHRKLSSEFRCAQGDMLGYDSAESKKLESEANKFASYLLMPINDFTNQVQGQNITLNLLRHCADRYKTSFTATALKWLEFTEEAALLAVADEDNYIRWSYPSKSARRLGAYLPPGTPLPQSSVELLNSMSNSHNRTRHVDEGAWHLKMDAEESLILSDQYEQVIFLVRFPSANLVNHAEEEEEDAFSVISEKIRGDNW